MDNYFNSYLVISQPTINESDDSKWFVRLNDQELFSFIIAEDGKSITDASK